MIPPSQTFVIGDLHGHLDRFEALLLQEGLIGRCEACDGTGQKSLDPIADDCSRCWGGGVWRNRPEVEIVLLGDVGHFGKDGSPTADMLTWEYALLWADVILWGNHDRAVVDERRHAFNGYMRPGPETYHRIARARELGKLKLAYEAYGFLLTHAGVHAYWQKDPKVPDQAKIDPGYAAHCLNYVEGSIHDDDVTAAPMVHWRDKIGIRRGGPGAGGILWRDVEEKLYTGFRQVFGHSADREHQVRYCWGDGNTRNPERIPPAVTDRVGRLDRPAIAGTSYCIDIGGKGDLPSDNCLAGLWLPDERIVRVDNV